MECPKCQTEIEIDDDEGTPTHCPDCGASLAAVPRRGGGAKRVLLISLILALLMLAAGSTAVALKTIRQRNAAEEELARAKKDFELASASVESSLAAIIGSEKLKDRESFRRELLKPYLDYYRAFLSAHGNDDNYLRERAAAQFHIAALQGRLRDSSAMATVGQGFNLLRQMEDKPIDPLTYPSVQEMTLRYVTPAELLGIRINESLPSQQELMPKVFMFTAIQSTLGRLIEKFPQAPGFRSDLAGIRRALAVNASMFPPFRQQGLVAWIGARDALEPLVRQQPDNIDYKTRLIEALVGAAKIQRGDARDEAIANYTRALELQQQLCAAAPDNEEYKKTLATVEKDLARLKASSEAPKAAEK